MITTIVLVVIGLLFLWACKRLTDDAKKVHGILDHIIAEAEATNDLNTLYALHTKLVQFATKECWGRHFGGHAKEVSLYISTKIECLVNKDEKKP